MESIPQLQEMFASHSPSIWSCVQECLTSDVHRLMNGNLVFTYLIYKSFVSYHKH